MTTKYMKVTLRRAIRGSVLAQIAFIILTWAAGEAVARTLDLPIPGSLIAMAVLLWMLLSGRLSHMFLRRGANWFLGEMLLFFIPAVLGVIDHPEFFGLLGAKILLVIIAGVVSVMTVTALTVEACARWRP